MESPPQPRCNRAVTKQIKGNATPKKHTNPMNASWKGTVEGLFFVEDSQKLKKTSSIRFLECKAKSNVNFLFLCLSNNLQHRGVLGMNQLTGKVCSTVFFSQAQSLYASGVQLDTPKARSTEGFANFGLHSPSKISKAPFKGPF